MNELVTRTGCGLYVIPGANPLAWPNFTWETTVVDLDGTGATGEDLDACALIQQELRHMIGTNRINGTNLYPSDIAFAALHHGRAPRADHDALDHADPEVPNFLVNADNGREHWTVCGILRNTWKPVSVHVTADNAVVAYYRAWQDAQLHEGQHLLLAAVHPGNLLNAHNLDYADPWAGGPEHMRLTADVWLER